jgi:hypothetical protein
MTLITRKSRVDHFAHALRSRYTHPDYTSLTSDTTALYPSRLRLLRGRCVVELHHQLCHCDAALHSRIAVPHQFICINQQLVKDRWGCRILYENAGADDRFCFASPSRKHCQGMVAWRASIALRRRKNSLRAICYFSAVDDLGGLSIRKSDIPTQSPTAQAKGNTVQPLQDSEPSKCPFQ